MCTSLKKNPIRLLLCGQADGTLVCASAPPASEGDTARAEEPTLSWVQRNSRAYNPRKVLLLCIDTSPQSDHRALQPIFQVFTPMYVAFFFGEFKERKAELGIGIHGNRSVWGRGACDSFECGRVKDLHVENDRCSGLPRGSRVRIAEDGLLNQSSYSNAHLSTRRWATTPSSHPQYLCVALTANSTTASGGAAGVFRLAGRLPWRRESPTWCLWAGKHALG